jgi:hypothetical protein
MSCPVVCSPLLVVEIAMGKLRLVFDLHYVTQIARRESMSCPVVCSPLLVVEIAMRKLRLVFDLRYVTQIKI